MAGTALPRGSFPQSLTDLATIWVFHARQYSKFAETTLRLGSCSYTVRSQDRVPSGYKMLLSKKIMVKGAARRGNLEIISSYGFAQSPA